MFCRYFAVDVLDIVDSPYSEQFVETFLPIVSNPEIFDKLTVTKVPSVMQFFQDVTTETEGDVVEGENIPSTSKVLCE